MRAIHILPLAAALLLSAGSAPVRASADGGTIAGTVTATPTKYRSETVVYLVHTAEKLESATSIVDQTNMHFVPHIRVIAAGDTVEFRNHDRVAHNVFSPEGNFNLGVFGYGEVKRHKFTGQGHYTLLCSLHPEMLGYVFAGQNRHAAAVNADGSFSLSDVPPGTYRIEVWNPHLKAAAQTVTVRAGATARLSFALRR